MLLSSSRVGILFMLLDFLIAPVQYMWKVFKSPRVMLMWRVSSLKIVSCIVLVFVACLAVVGAMRWSRANIATVELLVTGTGLLGTASHSVDDRGEHLKDTLRAISDHPLMGRSLGGITEAIASYSGARPLSFEESKNYEGQAVFAEVVVASGIPGSIPFFCFAVVTVVAPLRLARRTSPLFAAWLRALVLSLLFEWAILQLNQNILRLYLWVHIAMLATVFAAAEHLGLNVSGSGQETGTERSSDSLPA
jgi:hypothetical protein